VSSLQKFILLGYGAFYSCLLLACSLLYLLLDPEDGSDVLLCTVELNAKIYTAVYPTEDRTLVSAVRVKFDLHASSLAS
jgi:hypothetical protein